MDDREQEIAGWVMKALTEADAALPRSQQKVIGISQIGTCRELTRRDLLQLGDGPQPFRMDAWVGRAVGDQLEQDVIATLGMWDAVEHGTWQRQVPVEVTLPGKRFAMRGTADLAHPKGALWDGKSVDGYQLIERDGASTQQKYQRNLYALGLHQAGFFAVPIEQVEVADIYIDRSGGENRVVVDAGMFDWEVIYEAEAWIEDVVYAVERGEEASRDKPRPWCAKVCRHFRECRQFDTDVTGLITDDDTISAVNMYVEALADRKEAEQRREAAAKALRGVSGHTRTHTIRTISVNEAHVAFTRKPHERLDIRPIRSDD